MQESYGEGVASHTGPESCAGRGNVAGEALTGVHVGEVFSCEINPTGVPSPWTQAKATSTAALLASGPSQTFASKRRCRHDSNSLAG